MKIELFWFEDCPNHEAAAEMVAAILTERGLNVPIERVEVPNEETGKRVKFPGSPTIRVNDVDIEPGWTECDDCTPRCRLYLTKDGLKGMPEREWVESAIESAR